MPISRRHFFLSGLAGLSLAGCGGNLSHYGNMPLAEVASTSDICYSSYVVLKAGVPQAPVTVEGCSTPGAADAGEILQAASLTKPVVAFLALELVRAGKLDLRAPVSTYLPQGYVHRQKPFSEPNERDTDRVSPETLARIPLGSLLSHSSGLPNWTDGALKPEFEPGQRWQYSGEGYLLLQAVIAAVTGEPIEIAMARGVFEPLGMRDTRMSLTDDIRPRVIDGTGWLGRRSHYPFTQPNAAASMYTTAPDYAKFLRALASRQDLTTLILSNPVPVDPELGLAWGYGWGIEQAEGGPYLWQWGNNPGYRAFAMLSVSSGDGFVLMTNSENGLRMAASLAQSTLPAHHGVFRFGMLD